MPLVYPSHCSWTKLTTHATTRRSKTRLMLVAYIETSRVLILITGLFISDIPLHDATRDLVLMSEQFEADYKLTRNLEFLTDKLQQTYRELEGEKQKTDR